MTARLALFDLDGTLLSGDTDTLWCEFLIAAGETDPLQGRRNRELDERYARAEVGAAEYCAFHAGLLAGRSAQAWQPLRAVFVAQVIVPRLPASARALVQEHRRAGDRLVLSTATHRFLAEPIAAELGIAEVIATELEIDPAGCFTGRNVGVLNMRDGKPLRLGTWLAERGLAAGVLAAASFHSDSINDLPLLAAVGRPVAVDPDDRLRAEAAQRGWPIVELAR